MKATGIIGEYKQRGRTDLILGNKIAQDRSGIGAAWKTVNARDIPYAVREEIAAEIIEGERTGERTGEGQGQYTEYLASNGQHYRW